MCPKSKDKPTVQRKGLLDSDGNPQQGELLLQAVIASALRKQLVDLPGLLQGLLEPGKEQPVGMRQPQWTSK